MKRTKIILVFLIIIFSQMRIVYAVDEFIDNYENENYVQIKNNIVRNTTFNCMELEFNLNKEVKRENFSLYTQVDPGDQIDLNNDTWLRWEDMDQLQKRYVYYDFGVDYFDGDFNHTFDMKIIGADNGAPSWHYILANTLNDGRTMIVNKEDYIALMWYRDGVTIRFAFRHIGVGSELADVWVINYAQQHFKIIIERNEGEGKVYAHIYNLLTDTYNCTLSINLLENEDYRYLYASSNHFDGSAGLTSGWTLDMWIGEEYISGYYDSGNFTTENVLDNTGGNIEALLTNCSLLSDSNIKVQFSPNGMSWHNNDNVSNKADSLENGYGIFDLREQSYSGNFYMRYNFNISSDELTPRLYQVIVITDLTIENYVDIIMNFTDNFLNENYISSKNNIVRNSTLDCIELDKEYDLVIQDFDDYVEVDIPANRITKGDNDYHTKVDDLDRDETVYLYQDKGISGSGVNWVYNVTIRFRNELSDERLSVISWGQLLGDVLDQVNATGIRLSVTGGQETIYLFTKQKGVYSTDGYSCNVNQWYYCRSERSGASLTLYIYQNSDFTVLLDTLTRTLTNADEVYRYFFWVASEDKGQGGQSGDFDAKDVYVNDTAYISSGNFQTTLILDDLDFDILDMFYNISISTGVTIESRFSSDGVTWRTHDNVIGWDLLKVDEGLSLVDLTYRDLYIQYRLNTTNNLITPRLYRYEIHYPDVVSGDGIIYPIVLYGFIVILLLCVGVAIYDGKRKKRGR